ncbi:MAG TPA: M56 family metallopeptidase [Vicinamibacterales bacterium]|nr:M56 family metallopeptidase [Vicinamibacterales bacterium]
MSPILDSTIRVSIVVAVGLAVSHLLRRRSAATRHWVLAATMLCTLTVPVLQAIVPPWGMPSALLGSSRIAPPPASTPARGRDAMRVDDSIEVVAGSPRAPSAGRLTTVERFLVPLWIAGALSGLLLLAVGLARLTWIAARAARITSGAWAVIAAEIAEKYGVRRPVLLQADRPSLLITWGLAQPKVLVPISALGWTEDRIRIVLRHELAHARRGDWLVQLAGEILRCAYWFNPLLWIACTRLRQESEHACDDEVLAGGVEASAYAEHLLEVARELKPRVPPLPAPAITRSTKLERRFHAMLDARLTRTPASKAFRFVSAGLLLTATTIVAAAQNGPSILSGSVVDSTGAPVPGAVVALTNKTSDAKFEVKTDDRGRFEFVPLPADSYDLSVKYPGFKTAQEPLALAGASVKRDITLALGTLEETITIVGGGSEMSFVSGSIAAPPPQRTAERDLQRAAYQRDLQACAPSSEGGRVRPPRKIKDVRPVYPQVLQSAGVAGTVVLDATIDTDGLVKELSVIKSVHPALDEAAIEAVRQWQFDGTLLNCVPSEVRMKVSLNFKVQ